MKTKSHEARLARLLRRVCHEYYGEEINGPMPYRGCSKDELDAIVTCEIRDALLEVEEHWGKKACGPDYDGQSAVECTSTQEANDLCEKGKRCDVYSGNDSMDMNDEKPVPSESLLSPASVL